MQVKIVGSVVGVVSRKVKEREYTDLCILQDTEVVRVSVPSDKLAEAYQLAKGCDVTVTADVRLWTGDKGSRLLVNLVDVA